MVDEEPFDENVCWSLYLRVAERGEKEELKAGKKMWEMDAFGGHWRKEDLSFDTRCRQRQRRQRFWTTSLLPHPPPPPRLPPPPSPPPGGPPLPRESPWGKGSRRLKTRGKAPVNRQSCSHGTSEMPGGISNADLPFENQPIGGFCVICMRQPGSHFA